MHWGYMSSSQLLIALRLLTVKFLGAKQRGRIGISRSFTVTVRVYFLTMNNPHFVQFSTRPYHIMYVLPTGLLPLKIQFCKPQGHKKLFIISLLFFLSVWSWNRPMIMNRSEVSHFDSKHLIYLFLKSLSFLSYWVRMLTICITIVVERMERRDLLSIHCE